MLVPLRQDCSLSRLAGVTSCICPRKNKYAYIYIYFMAYTLIFAKCGHSCSTLLLQCIPSKQARETASDRLASFYKKFSSDKLDEQGELKDADAVWKKWKNREPELYS